MEIIVPLFVLAVCIPFAGWIVYDYMAERRAERVYRDECDDKQWREHIDRTAEWVFPPYFHSVIPK